MQEKNARARNLFQFSNRAFVLLDSTTRFPLLRPVGLAHRIARKAHVRLLIHFLALPASGFKGAFE